MAPANYTINIDTTAPTTPVNNISSYYNTAQINLSWSAGTDFFGIAYYIAQLANNSDFSNSVDRNTTNTSQISGNLTDGVTYFLRVKAVDGSGLSSNYSNTTNTTIDLTAPSAPANLSPSETSNDDTPVLSWSASLEATSGVSSYFVTLSNSTYSANQTSNSTSMQENVTLYDGHYNFSVRATDRAGNTGNASTSNFTVKTLFINEVSPNSPVDWIELYNIETKNYSLAGWRLGSRTANYTLTQNITGGSYLLLNATTTNLTLNAANDSVLLYLPNGTLWDNTSFSGILENNSFGRSRDGVGAFQAFNENQSTPGAANTQTLGITMQSGWNLIGIPLVI
jgi:hypothetical protein